MTTTNDKIRSVALTSLLVLSVFAGTAGFVGSAAAANFEESGAEAAVQSGGLFWQGQTLYVGAANADVVDPNNDGSVTWELRTVEGSGEGASEGNLVTEVTLTEDEDGRYWATIDSGERNLDGDYVFITNDDGQYAQFNADGPAGVLDAKTNTISDATFEVANQNFQASVDPVNVTQGSTTELNLDSNRGSYDVVVSSNDLDLNELEVLASGFYESIDDVETADTNNDEDPDAVVIPGQDGTLQTEVGDSTVPVGNHSIDFTVQDTGETASVNLNVGEPGDVSYSFVQSYPSQEQGDIAAINVSIQNDDTAWLQIGSEEVNFQVNAQVTDENGDGYVTVLFNTFRTDTANEESSISNMLSAAGDDTLSNANLQTPALDSPIEPGDYGLSIYDGNPENEDSEERAFGTLVINERSTDSAQTWVAPGGATLDQTGQIYQAVSQGDSVAIGDVAIVEVQASGLYGFLDDGGSVGENGVHLSVLQTNPQANQPAEEITNYDIVTDAENNTLFAVIPTSELGDDYEAGQEYQATFTVENEDDDLAGQYSLVPDGESQSVNATFSLAAPEVNFEGAADQGPLAVAQGEANVSGTTSFAPGTEFQVTARSTAANLLQSRTVTVNDNGSWTANFDFSDVDNGTEFRFTNSLTDNEVNAIISTDVQAGGETTTTTTTETTTTTTTTETTTTTTTETTTTTTEETETTTTTEGGNGGDGGIPGFGVSVALVALLAAALLAIRRARGQ